MKGRVFSAAILAAMIASGTYPVTAQDKSTQGTPSGTAPAAITYFDGASWAPLERHDVYVKYARPLTAGVAPAPSTATPEVRETYVVLTGPTSEVLLSGPRPRFRIASDRTGAFRMRLARFDTENKNRRTRIEPVKNAVFFTNGIDLEFMEVAEGLWEITPAELLQPGEYAFVVSDTQPVADFTIVRKEY
jgi:hypothetical protein